MLQRRVKILAPVPARVAHILLKAPGVRVVGPLAAIVPLPEGPRGVAGLQKVIRHRLHVRVQALLPRGHAQHAAS